jgi:hypothetical protein
MCVCMYILTERERERERGWDRGRERGREGERETNAYIYIYNIYNLYILIHICRSVMAMESPGGDDIYTYIYVQVGDGDRVARRR